MNNGLLITGDNVHVYKYIGASPFEIVCATGMELLKQVEIIGATTPDSGTHVEVRPRLESTSLTLTGASTSENDGDVSIFYMAENIREAHDLEIVFTDNNGSEKSYRQDFYIERLMRNGNSGESSQYEILLRGTGPYTEAELVDPELTGDNVISDYYTVAGGIITDARWDGLTDANIVEVCREGTEQLSMGLIYTFDEPTTSITPDPATTIDGQRMLVIWTF